MKYIYDKYSDHVEITKYIGYATTTIDTITIPEQIENLPVTSIGYYAFFDCNNLTDAGIIIFQNPNDNSTTMTINVYTIQLNTSITDINIGNSTVTDYTDAGITGVTADNLDVVNSAVAVARNATGSGIKLTKSQIQEAITNGVATLTLTQNDSILIAQLKKIDGAAFTTAIPVTYYWYRDDAEISAGNANTYDLSNADKGTSLKAKVSIYVLESNTIAIPNDIVTPPPVIVPPIGDITTPPAVVIPPIDEVTTPAIVTIKGTQRVGKTLEAVLLTNSGSKFTTSAGVTYEWYRLSSKNSNSFDLVGSDETYKLVSSDEDNYIKLIATYNVQSFEDITGKIARRSSSSSSSSASSSSSSSTNDDSNSSTNTLPVITPVQIANGWQKQSDGTWKYGENGHYISGWEQIDGLWYLFDLNSIMQSSWKQEDNKWYYLGSDGAMQVGWELINGKWYLFKISGEMITGWAQMDGKWYYLNSDGAMATSWINVNGEWYYLYGDGSLAVNATVNGYNVDENGV